MTDETKRRLRSVAPKTSDLGRSAFRSGAVTGLGEFLRESGNLLPLSALEALERLTCEFAEFDFEDTP